MVQGEKTRKTRTPIGPEDGERVLAICLRKLKKLNPEWRRFVIASVEAYGRIGLEKQGDLLPK